MDDACIRERWARTAAVMALIAEVNRDPKKGRPFQAADFDPFAAADRREEAIEIVELADLKQAFVSQMRPTRPVNPPKE